MKDYYKILGIKESASEEEIRVRWIKLMRRFHPDSKGHKESHQSKAKEINEAYQVLKDESARMKYDLQRNYYREKQRLQRRRKGLLASLLGGLLVIGLILFLKFLPHEDPGVKSYKLSVAGETRRPQKEEGKVISYKLSVDKKGQDAQREEEQVTGYKLLVNQKGQEAQKEETVKAGEMQRTQREDTGKAPKQEGKAIIRSDVDHTEDRHSRESGDPGKYWIPDRVRNDKPESTYVVMHNDQLWVDKEGQRPQKEEEQVKGYKLSVDKETQGNQEQNVAKGSRETEPEKRGSGDTEKQGREQIADEEAVRHFFARYLDRYVRKDADGFLSCFSLKAMQNRTDGIQGIRKIYTTFFSQSRELRYELQDLSPDFYQNGVTVKARYQLDQVLKTGGRRTWQGEIRWTLIQEEGSLKILSIDYQQQ